MEEAGRKIDKIKGVPVKMSSFVFTFCVFPTTFNVCYTGLLPEILQAMLECPKLGFYPKFCVDLVDLSSRDQKRQKTKPDIFTDKMTFERIKKEKGY